MVGPNPSRSGCRRRDTTLRSSTTRVGYRRRLRFEPLEERRLLATLTVNSTLDNLTAGDGLVTLREAIQAANGDTITDLGQTGSGADTIEFDPVVFATAQTIALAMGELQISQALTIDGPGAALLTINAQLQSRIFNVSASSGAIEFMGLKLTGGKTVGDGGAIYADSNATLTLNDCTITGNTANFGSAIYGDANLDISDCTITGNTSLSENAHSVHEFALVNVNNSTIGGGIRGNQLSLVDSMVTSGGVHFGTVTLVNSEVTGGIYSYGAVKLTDSTVASEGITSFGNVESIRSAIHGDVILVEGNVSLVDNSSITNGSIIATAEGSGDVTVIDSSITGGNVRTVSAGSDITIIGSTITGSSQRGVSTTYANITITSSIISSHALDGVQSIFGITTVNDSRIFGNELAGVSSNFGDIFVSNSLIYDNETYGISAGDHDGIDDEKLVVSNSTISGNLRGGIKASRDVTVTGSTIRDNGHGMGQTEGGILAVVATVIDSAIIGNHSSSGVFDGGGISAEGLVMENSTVSGNSAVGNGGGIAAQIVTIEFSTITENEATGVGGGVSTVSGHIHGSIIANNSAIGGSPDVQGSAAVTLENSLIGDNSGTTFDEAPTFDDDGNLIGSLTGSGVIDPRLAPLAFNGGPTPTHALLPDSPALDAISPPPTMPGIADDAVHIYELNGSLEDAKGGPSLVALGGTLDSTGYAFGAGQGLNLSLPDINPDEYSIEILFSWSALSGSWQKIIDFQDRTVDNGLYTLGAGLQFLSEAFTDNLFAANSPRHLVLTRDAATDTVKAYVGGTLRWSFVDDTDLAVFSGADAIMRFFQDDLASGGTEVQGGFVDYIRIFDRELMASEVTDLFDPPPESTIPEFDQRGLGYKRLFDADGIGGAKIDMGAFEAQPIPTTFGDYNLDGNVNAADYTVWRDMAGITDLNAYQGADGNGDGVVDREDYGIWKQHYGEMVPMIGGGGGIAAAIATEAVSTPPPALLPATDSAVSLNATAAGAAPADVLPTQPSASTGDLSGAWLRADAAALNRSPHAPRSVDSAATTTIQGGGPRDDALLAWLTAPPLRSDDGSYSFDAELGDSNHGEADPQFDEIDAVFATVGQL